MNFSFLEQFDKYRESQNLAVVCGETSITYAELHKRCVALASKLRSLSVGMDSTSPEFYDIFNPKKTQHSPWVIIITGRSADTIIGVIATMMAGGAYVLAEQSAPDAYVQDILEDTVANVVIRGGSFLNAEEIKDFTYTFPKENEIACAVFTSGSTGKPKGAVLEHRVLNEMLRWQAEYMNPAQKGWTATAAYAPLGFIAVTWEIFFPLANGLTLHMLTETIRHDLFALEEYIENNHISYMFLPPNIAEIFTKTYKGNALKYLRIAGGRLNSCGNPGSMGEQSGDSRTTSPDEGRYEIMYHLGMSENGGSVTLKSINHAMSGDIPVGKAWNKTKVTIDADTGEIGVAGPSLFRGYLARPEETLGKLVKNPYTDEPGYEMIYKSGDLARLDENGEIVYIGRNDWDIKIRDMKVNPMQMESALAECKGVSECCVTTQIFDGENKLIGWTVGVAESETLKAELLSRFPEYMIPSVIVSLEKFPLNVNGKIHRSALVYSRENNMENHSGTNNMSEMELKIAEIFGRLLGSSKRYVGAEDSFLKLGGDSLKFMRLQTEIAREFSQNIPYAVLFENPTPRMIAAIMQNQESNANMPIPLATPMEAYPLSSPMRQMWLLWRTGQDRGKYTVSIKCQFIGELDESRALAAFKELIRRNAILRSRFVERHGEVFQVIEENVEVSFSDEPRRVFDLTKTPMFDITLKQNILSFTTHHIIADAMGQRILLEDFWTLYGRREPQKTVQAHDVTMWSLSKDISADEKHWLQMFSDKPPTLTLPYDFARPNKITAAAQETVFFNETEATRLREYAFSHNATLFQLFLAGYALLLSKLSGSVLSADCKSVVIGVPFSGREYPDTARTIGMLVRTLPIKLDIGSMNLDDALDYTRKQFAAAWEHQDISIERLAEKINPPRSAGRNPFYDVMINYLPFPRPLPDVDGLRPKALRGEYPGALFDLVLDLREEENGVSAVFSYATELFKSKTVKQWAETFTNILTRVCSHWRSGNTP